MVGPSVRGLRAGSRRRRRQRGAVLVELAIVTPFLLMVVLGMTELGLRMGDQQDVVSGTRAAARVGSSAGDSRLADHDILQSLAGALEPFEPADIQQIIVYKAAADGSMPAGCDTGPQAGLCNHYTAADLARPSGDFTTAGSSCATTAPDASWCPLDRNAEQYPGADWIGVYVAVGRETVAPFLGDTVIDDQTVMRLEPRFD